MARSQLSRGASSAHSRLTNNLNAAQLLVLLTLLSLVSRMSLAMMLGCICFLRCVTHSYLSLLDVDKFCATRANEPCRVEHLACGDSHLGSLRCVYAVDSQWLNSVCVPTCLVNLSYDAGASTSSLSPSEIARAVQPDLSSCTNCSYNVSQLYPLTAEQKERTANVTAQQQLRVATVNSTVRYRLQTTEVTNTLCPSHNH